MVALTGTGRLADDIYLLAHHEVSGRPLLQSRAIGLGLVGGLLAEPVLFGAIRVVGDVLAATDRVHPQDGLMRAVQLQMLSERQRHCVENWPAFLAQTAAEDVARRAADPGASGERERSKIMTSINNKHLTAYPAEPAAVRFLAGIGQKRQ